jgi:hypothetical protein
MMKLRLIGPSAQGLRVSGPLMRDVLAALVEGTQRAVRLRLEGRSTSGGPVPAWLEQAAAFDLRIEEGSTQLVLDAPNLSAAAPEQFAQAQLFDEVPADRSCLDLFVDSLDDALNRRYDSVLFDDGLLQALWMFRGAFRHGVDTIEVVNGRTLRLDAEAVEGFDALKRGIPPDQRVILAGTLDELRHSSRMFTLVLEDGASIRGVVSGGFELERLGPLWGKKARVSGTAKFRPSGAILRAECDDIQPVDGDISIWSRAPQPLFTEFDVRALHQEQGPRSGVSAIFGKWPGEESEEEFLRALSEVS